MKLRCGLVGLMASAVADARRETDGEVAVVAVAFDAHAVASTARSQTRTSRAFRIVASFHGGFDARPRVVRAFRLPARCVLPHKRLRSCVRGLSANALAAAHDELDLVERREILEWVRREPDQIPGLAPGERAKRHGLQNPLGREPGSREVLRLPGLDPRG